MNKGKNRRGTSGHNSALGPGVQAPDFKLRSTQSLRPDRETGAPGAPAPEFKLQTLGILDALEALGSKREVAA